MEKCYVWNNCNKKGMEKKKQNQRQKVENEFFFFFCKHLFFDRPQSWARIPERKSETKSMKSATLARRDLAETAHSEKDYYLNRWMVREHARMFNQLATAELFIRDRARCAFLTNLIWLNSLDILVVYPSVAGIPKNSNP